MEDVKSNIVPVGMLKDPQMEDVDDNCLLYCASVELLFREGRSCI